MRSRVSWYVLACAACCGAPAAGAETPARGMSADDVLALVKSVEAATPSAPSLLADLDVRTEQGRTLARRLRTTRLDIAFDRASVDDVLAYVQKTAGFTVVVSAKARAALAHEAPKVSLRLRNLAALDVLELLAAQLGEYRFSARHGVLMLFTNAEYRPVTVLKVYDVRDLTAPRRDFTGPRLSLKLTDEPEG